MQARLMNALNIRPGEGRNVFLMLAHYFFMGAAMVLGTSSSLALFFDAWDITALPYVYLGMAFIVSSITALFLKLSERTSLARFLVLCLSFILFGTIALRVGLALTSSKWLLLALPIWASALLYLSVTAFWTLAGNLFDIRQSKRIFGLMNAGSWLAYVVIGPFTTPLVNLYGTKNLYTAIAACVLFALIFLLVILRANPHISATPQPTHAQTKSISIRSLLRKKYVVLIFLLIAAWQIALFFLDNIFYDRAALRFTDADSMAGFLGLFFAAAGLLGFITDVFLTGRIISRFGLRAGLLTTPTLTILCATAIAFTGIVDSSQLVVLFVFAATGRFFNEGLGFSLDQSSFAVINQPLEEVERARVQAIAEGIIRPLATGLAGVLLLVFNTALKFKATQLAYVYLLIAGAWVTLGIFLIRVYPGTLKEALHKRRFGENGIALVDRASSKLLHNALKSPHSNDITYALDLLEQTERDAYLDINIQLINSEHSQVRLNVIQRIERLNLAEALPALKDRLGVETEPSVLQAAARALTFMKVRYVVLLDSNDPHIRRGALIGILRVNHAKPFSDARERLVGLAGSMSEKERAEAANIIGESGNPSLSDIALNLLSDSNQNVHVAAIHAAGKIGHASLWASVIAALDLPYARRAAFSALVAGGEAALAEIMRGIVDEALPLQTRIRLVRACGKIKSPAAIAELKKLLDYPNVNLRSRALIALHTCNFFAEKDFVPNIEKQIQRETERAAWLLACLNDVRQSEETEILIRALHYDLNETRNRLFYLFSFIYDPLTVRWALQAFVHNDANRRAYAIEMMDSILSSEHNTIFMPLLEDYSDKERLEKMSAFYKQDALANDERISRIVFNQFALEFPWLVASALQAARELNLPDSDVTLQFLLNSNQRAIVGLVQRIETEDSVMLTTFERVMILKSLNLFAATPDEALVEIADLLEEVEVRAGKNVVEKGADGDSLYVIVQGKVAVMDDGRVLNELGERAVFGELSFLDSSPRTATIRTIEDTTLLRLAQALFYDLMGNYTEVAMGTIQMLTRALRARTTDVVELNRMLQ